MNRLRHTTIAAALIAAVALIAPAASQAADSALGGTRAQLISVVEPADDEPVVINLRVQSISTLGWGWGG